MNNIIAVLSVFYLSILSLHAQSVYDVFTYKEPAGYSKSDRQGSISYTKTNNIKNNYCVLTLYNAVENSNNPVEAFKKDWNELISMPYSIKNEPVIETMPDINGWNALKASSAFEFNGSTATATLFCFVRENQVADIVALTNGNEYNIDINGLISNLKLGVKLNPYANNLAVDNRVVNNTSGSIAGIWLYYGLDGNTQMSWQEMVFFSDGSSIDVIPKEGLYNYSTENERNSYAHIGKYNFSNGKGTNQLTPTYKETLNLIKPGQLKIDSRLYTKSVEINGQKFSGSYTSYADPGDPQIQTLPFGQKPVIHFYQDGKFKDEGLFATFLQSFGEHNDAAGSGSYELKDYSVILKYSDGRARQEAFYTVFANDIGSAERIFIGKGILNKMK